MTLRVLYGDTSIQLTANNIVNTDESLDTIEVLAIIVPPGFQKITETQVLDKVYLDGWRFVWMENLNAGRAFQMVGIFSIHYILTIVG